MTELEREIFMRLLIDLFSERPAIEQREKEKRDALNARTETDIPQNHFLEDFSKKTLAVPVRSTHINRAES